MVCAPSLLSGIVIVAPKPCGSSRAERLCDPSELRVRRLTAHRLDERFEVRPLAPLVRVANRHAGFPVNGVKRRDGDASLLDFTDKTLIEPAAHTHVAVGYKCRPSRHGQIASHSNLNRFAKGARAPLEPQRGKGLKVQDVTRVFWPRGTLRWCCDKTWGDRGG
jgi:hypothetical protein